MCFKVDTPSFDAFHNLTNMERERRAAVAETSDPEAALSSTIPSAPTMADFDVEENSTKPSVSAPPDVTSTPTPSAPSDTFDVSSLSQDIRHAVARDVTKNDATAPSNYAALSQDLVHMEPHAVLRPQLTAMSSAPEVIIPPETFSGPTFSLLGLDCPLDPSIKPFSEQQLLNLYCNPELNRNDQFVTEFLSSQKDVARHELHELLLNYQRVRSTRIHSEKTVRSQLASSEENYDNLWSFEEREAKEEGECQDKKMVVAIHKYKVANFSSQASSSLHKALKDTKTSVTENLSLESYKCEVLRLKIEALVYQLVKENRQENLKKNISVLFSFQRRLIRDKEFLDEVRVWLDKLITQLLHEGDFSCHLFLLNHVLRCPRGVGKWGARYVQPPPPMHDNSETEFDNPNLHHLLTVLSTLLSPIKDREKLLSELKVTSAPVITTPSEVEEDNVWTVLDSDGEEDTDQSWAWLKENDLVAVLTQIPIDAIFKYVLKVERRDGKDYYDPSLSSEKSFLTLLAFATRFVYVLREGLATFNADNGRYKNFSNRLGQLIRQTIEFVSNHWQAFKMSRVQQVDLAMFMRIQIEYDTFFLRAVKCLFSARTLGAWQYMALIPYGTISINVLWNIFYVLHLDGNNVQDEQFDIETKGWN